MNAALETQFPVTGTNHETSALTSARGRRNALIALVTAGVLWGSTVPLTKVALEWLPPVWLAAVRCLVAAVVLVIIARRFLADALSPAVLLSGAIGYGLSIVIHNLGLERTSVTHAALLIGSTPVLVAVMAAMVHRRISHPLAWLGYAVSIVGVIFIAGGQSSGATLLGDALVLVSVLLVCALTVAQPGLLRDRDAAAVTAVQFLGASVVTLPMAIGIEGGVGSAFGLPTVGLLVAVVALALLGTLAPFTLFAWAQQRVSPQLAGVFVNIEPVVGVAAGAVFFAESLTNAQLLGGVAILGGIAVSAVAELQLISVVRRRRAAARARQQHAHSSALEGWHQHLPALEIAQ